MRRMQQGLSCTVLSIRSNVEQMNAGVGEIAAAGNDMSDRTAQQAAALQETTANMSALDSTVQRSAARAQEAERGARAATELARAAGDAVGRAESRMIEMSREADRISAIVNVVESIAFQTNILALNAAVEA
ncbi:MAG: methyl-accepting chemotaxis protein, partial [Burkholderiaceae bacterium]|nr:methyl-accepting chemotaxis protein [Burkholderiaceae bacterium]